MGTFRATLFAFAASLALLASTHSLRAQIAPPTLLYTYDENGHGSLKLSNGTIIPYVGTLAPDPGPGGLSSALTYSLGTAAIVTSGDLFLLEPGQRENTVSDLLRFNFNPQTGTSTLVFYSDNLDGAEDLADVGFPSTFYANTLTVTEVGPEGDNGFMYTPTSGQPGFISGFNTTYNFISDASAVPLPSAAWGGLALLALLAIQRLRRPQRAQVPH